MIDMSDLVARDLQNNTVKITNYGSQQNVDGVLVNGEQVVYNSVPVVALTLSAVRASQLNIDVVSSFEITISTGHQCYHGKQLPSGAVPASVIEMDELQYRVVKAENYPTEKLCIAIMELIR